MCVLKQAWTCAAELEAGGAAGKQGLASKPVPLPPSCLHDNLEAQLSLCSCWGEQIAANLGIVTCARCLRIALPADLSAFLTAASLVLYAPTWIHTR